MKITDETILTEEIIESIGFRMHEGDMYQRYWIRGDFKTGFELTFRPIPQHFTFCFTERRKDTRTDLVVNSVGHLKALFRSIQCTELTIPSCS